MRSTMTLAGLRSRCTSPTWWAAWSALGDLLDEQAPSARRERSLKTLPRGSPATSCMAMNGRPSVSPTSKTLQT